MSFKCEWLEERSEDGTIVATGVHWTEGRPFLDMLSLVGGIGAVLLGLAIALRGYPEGFLFIILGVAAVWHLFATPGRPREIVFRSDGRMETPLGLSTGFLWPGQRWLDHTGIKSIETELVDKDRMYTHGVRIFYDGGETNHVAKNLPPDAAHMVAVRLTTALRRLRKSLAETARSGQRTVEKVIE